MTNYRDIIAILSAFRAEDSGAVTVDWVVLTSAVIGLGLAVLLSVSGGTLDLADGISDFLASLMQGPPPPPGLG